MESLLCTVAETAALLHVSVDTVTRQIKAGLIPCKRIRASVRISRAWIDSFVAESAPILLTRRQVSVKLGISLRSLHTLQIKGLLPTVMLGRWQRIPAAAVAEYAKRNAFAFLRSSKAPRQCMPESGIHAAVAAPVGAPSRRLGFGMVRGI